MKRHLTISLLITFMALVLPKQSLAYSNELKIYVIKPKVRIDWSGPRNLSITSAVNSMGDDYAPIGHLAVEIKCQAPNKYGINHVLTGMERVDKVESRRIALQKKLGLGSLIYSFKGQLQSSDLSLSEIREAEIDQRLNVITVPTSSKRCQMLLDFVDQWIKAGSYQIYGGAKKVKKGEGAGCADFAMVLFEIAANQEAPNAWNVSIKVPLSLVGDGKNKKVNFSELLLRSDWARPSEQHMPYKIADMNRITDWLRKRLPETSQHLTYTTHLFPYGTISQNERDYRKAVEQAASTMPKPQALRKFTFRYPLRLSPAQVWKKIIIKDIP